MKYSKWLIVVYMSHTKFSIIIKKYSSSYTYGEKYVRYCVKYMCSNIIFHMKICKLYKI